jgi:hypothetical protein
MHARNPAPLAPIPASMPTPSARWTVRRHELGRTTFDVITPACRITLELMDGGGYVASFGVWRIEGRVVRVVEAGSG